jgi:hypothetical protein
LNFGDNKNNDWLLISESRILEYRLSSKPSWFVYKCLIWSAWINRRQNFASQSYAWQCWPHRLNFSFVQTLSLYTIPDHCVEWTNCHSVYVPYLILVWYEQTVTQFIYHTWSFYGMNKLSLSLFTIPDHCVEWTNCHSVYIPYLIIVGNEQTVTQFIYHTWSLWGMNKLSLSAETPALTTTVNSCSRLG